MAHSRGMSEPAQAVDPSAHRPGQVGYGVSTAVLAATAESARRTAVIAIALVVVVTVVLGGALILTRQELQQAQERIAALSAGATQPGATQPGATQPGATQPGSSQAAPAPESGVGPAEDLRIAVPSGADATGALLLGDETPADTIEVFVDFQCPFCQRWDQQFGAALIDRALEENSDLLVKVVPMAFLDEADVRNLSTPGASARAANAVACLAHTESDSVTSGFITGLFAAADPREPAGQFPSEQLQQIAREAGAGSPASDCIAKGRFLPYIAKVTTAAFGRGVTGTPTVVLNGATLANPFTDQGLRRLLDAGASSAVG